MIQPKVLKKGVICSPLRGSVKCVHGENEQCGREWIALADTTSQIDMRSSLPIDHDRGERRAKDSTNEVAEDITESPTP
jgi:hypothetical protein